MFTTLIKQFTNCSVPMKGVFEALNAKIEWEGATNTVTATKGDTTIVLTIGNAYAHVNGQKVALATEAIIVNGSTMVPLRFVAEALGAKVGWDAPTYTAIITNQGGSGVSNPTTNPSTSTEVTNPRAVQAQETFGRTYGISNQAEYDTVVKMAKEALANLDNIEVPKAMIDYLYNGARGVEKPGLGFYNLELVGYEQQLSPLLEAGISADTLVHSYKVNTIVREFTGTSSDDTT